LYPSFRQSRPGDLDYDPGGGRVQTAHELGGHAVGVDDLLVGGAFIPPGQGPAVLEGADDAGQTIHQPGAQLPQVVRITELVG
jgi:hypothetical protein